MYFFESHCRGKNVQAITNDYYTWSKLSSLYSANKTYGGFTVYRFGSTKITPPTPPTGGSITITTNSLPNGKVGEKYKQRIYYDGDTATSCEISGGSLPEGLTLTLSNGQVHIEGTPTKGGDFNFTVRLKSSTKSGEKSYTVNISGGSEPPTGGINITTNSLPNGKVGEKYKQRIYYDGDTATSCEISGGSLPEGLTLTLSNGQVHIEGTPTKGGDFNFTVRLKSSTKSGEKSYTVNISGGTVTPAPAPSVPNSWNLSGTELVITSSGNTYRFQQEASDGDKRFIITGLPNGSVIPLPAGWTVDTDGRAVTVNDPSKVSSLGGDGVRISGACRITINYVGITFTARQTNQDTTPPEQDPPTVDEPSDGSVSITNPNTLKNGRYMRNYRLRLKLKGAKSASWTIINGSLPEGLTLDPSSGIIKGKPQEWDETTFEFTVRADTPNGTAEKTFSLQILPVKPKIKYSLKKGRAGYEYLGVITATGSDPMEWEVENLPDGLDFEINDDGDTCTITGIPEEESKSRIRVTVTNSAGSVSKNIRLVIKPEIPDICADDMPKGIIGRYYEAELDSPGNPKWSWSGRVPPGLSLNKLTGVISGVPEMAGEFAFKVKAKNSSGSDYEQFTIIISEGENYASPAEESEGLGQTGQEIFAGTAVDFGSMSLSVDGDEYLVVALLSEDIIEFENSGQRDFLIHLDENVPSGLKLYYFARPQNCEPSEDDEIVDFCGTSGEYIDNVPEDRVITVSPWFTPGVIYNPVVAVKAKDLK